MVLKWENFYPFTQQLLKFKSDTRQHVNTKIIVYLPFWLVEYFSKSKIFYTIISFQQRALFAVNTHRIDL